jgi:aryl-alcohol dehydrogenase
LARVDNVVKIARDLPLGIFAPLGCGVQTGAGAVLNTFKAEAGSTLVVFGCGAVGLSAVAAAASIAACSKVVAVDLHSSRLNLATKIGATHTHLVDISAGNESVVAAIMEATGGGANYVLDTSGNASSMRAGVESLAPLGVMGMVAPGAPGQHLDVPTMSLLAGKHFRGIIQGDSVPQVFIPQLIEFWRQGRLPFESFVSYYDGLDSINTAVAEMATGSAIKPVLRIDTNAEYWAK